MTSSQLYWPAGEGHATTLQLRVRRVHIPKEFADALLGLSFLLNAGGQANPDHNDRSIVDPLQPPSSPKANPMSSYSSILAYEPSALSAGSFTFDTSGQLPDNTIFPSSSLPFGHLHETFFSEMPFELPTTTDDTSNWNIFQTEYETLLNYQS